MTKKTKIYAEVLEDTAMEQFNEAMEQDFVEQGALMPDAHTGYTLPIGAVVACRDVVVPSYVGYDIGCGMCAVPTTFSKVDVIAQRDAIFDKIYEYVPVGFKVNERNPKTEITPEGLSPVGLEAFSKRRGLKGLGTLGGGNHFLEIGYDETDAVWIVIHSGSRGVGHGIATAYMKLASPTGKASEGHFPLHVGTKDGDNYINDMNWALEFALENRRIIIEKATAAIGKFCEGGAITDRLINRNHNHAELKDGRWIHRKGATHAEDGMMGVIPGNMKDGSFIVRGKGNPDSMCSSSHGAGRIMSRKAARENIDMDKFKESMKGIKALIVEGTIDESPEAYKNIHEVMALQEDLVDVLHHVKPIINIKAKEEKRKKRKKDETVAKR